MAKRKISADERSWRAEADANTMARYEEIMADSARRSAAMKSAKAQASELQKSADAMRRAASTKSRK